MWYSLLDKATGRDLGHFIWHLLAGGRHRGWWLEVVSVRIRAVGTYANTDGVIVHIERICGKLIIKERDFGVTVLAYRCTMIVFTSLSKIVQLEMG